MKLKIIMRKTILLIFLLHFTILYCQNTQDIFFKITDSVIKKRDYPYATKINLEISVPDFQYSFFLYNFPKSVASYEWSVQRKKNLVYQGVASNESRMQYIIEDENHEIIEYTSDYFTLLCKYLPIDARFERMGTFVSSKHKIIRKKLKLKERLEYKFAKFEINSSKQNVPLFLLLSIYHHDLPKGEYWIYLSYSPTQSFYSTSNPERIISNKVKLIVE